MSENLPTTLNCPACGAPLDFDGSSSVVRCKFCRNVSFVPGALLTRSGTPSLSLDQIRLLIRDGDLVEAVRKYRELFGVGLKEAKQAVDALQAGRLVEPSAGGPARADQTRGLQEIQQLLAEGNKIEAIKRYRELYDVSLARAKYAVEQIEAGQTTWPEAGFPEAAPPSPQVQPSQSGARVGMIITILILAVVSGILYFAFSQPGSPLNPSFYASGPAVMAPADGKGTPDLAALFYSPDADARMIGLVDGETGEFRWRAEPLSGDGFADAIAVAGGLVYTANGTDLLAYHRSDGSLAWQAVMPDKLNYGDAEMLIAAGRVITSNLDQSLQAYDVENGQLVWSRRLAGYDRTLRILGGSLVVIDYTDEDHTYSLIFLDPASGEEQRTLTPTCAYDQYSSAEIDPSSGLAYDESGDALYLIFDSSYDCVQRLDLASGQTVWQTINEDSYSIAPDGFYTLMAGNTFYFFDGDRLLAVDKSDGTTRSLLADQDYELLPLAAASDRLIVRARRTRGSERFELWGLEASSGERLWQFDLGNASPVDPPDEMAGLVDQDESGWTWRLAPVGLLLVRFQAEPNQLVLETIDPADGTSLGQQIVPLKKVTGDFYSVPTIIGWQGDLLYISLDSNLYAVDTAAGALKFVR
jgi:outer membrane protein assembly factor BamB